MCFNVPINPPPKNGSSTERVCRLSYLDGLNTYIGSDGPDAISPKVFGLFNTDITSFNLGKPLSTAPDWMPIGPYVQGVYFRWWDLKLRKAAAQNRYDDAVKKEASAKQSYDTLSTMTLSSPGGAGGGNAIWGAPIDMLKQIEKNGAIR